MKKYLATLFLIVLSGGSTFATNPAPVDYPLNKPQTESFAVNTLTDEEKKLVDKAIKYELGYDDRFCAFLAGKLQCDFPITDEIKRGLEPTEEEALAFFELVYQKKGIDDVVRKDTPLSADMRYSLTVIAVSVYNVISFNKRTKNNKKIDNIYVSQSINTLPKLLNIIKSINTLNFVKLELSDLKLLKNIENINKLVLARNNLLDLTPLKKFRDLEILWLQNNPLSDISPLKDLKSLVELDLSVTNVEDLSPLFELPKLAHLVLEGLKLKNYDFVSNLKNLKRLDLSGTSIKDLTPLKDLTNLETLGIDYTEVDDLTPLQNLKNLRSIYIADSLIDTPEKLQKVLALFSPKVSIHRLGQEPLQGTRKE